MKIGRYFGSRGWGLWVKLVMVIGFFGLMIVFGLGMWVILVDEIKFAWGVYGKKIVVCR